MLCLGSEKRVDTAGCIDETIRRCFRKGRRLQQRYLIISGGQALGPLEREFSMKRAVKTLVNWMGYEIYKKPQAGVVASYRLIVPTNDAGALDYESYRKIQTQLNKQKIDRVWAERENIEHIAGYIKSRIEHPEFGICHGTRRGLEQGWFSEALGCKVIGTEISDTAQDFPNTIQWDFHEVKDEWVAAADFIYSNSIDHSYDPEHCLKQWTRCLKPGGLLILEYNASHSLKEAKSGDPFGVDLKDFVYLITKWGQGQFWVQELLDRLPVQKLADHCGIVIARG